MSRRLSPFYVLYPDRKTADSMGGPVEPRALRKGLTTFGEYNVVGVYDLDNLENNQALVRMVIEHADPFENYERYRGCFYSEHSRFGAQQVQLWTVQGLVIADTDHRDRNGKFPGMHRPTAPVIVTQNYTLREFIQDKLAAGHSFELIKDFLFGVQVLLNRSPIERKRELSSELWTIWRQYWEEKVGDLFPLADPFTIQSVGLRLAYSCLSNED